MEIKIQDDKDEIFFSNELLDNDNFVQITLGIEDAPEKTFHTVIMPISELFAAIQAFDQLQKNRLERESLME